MIIQGSPEWFAQRVGKVTASCFYDVAATQKSGKPYASRESYMVEKVIELYTGLPLPAITAPALEHGNTCEPLARADYEMLTGNIVDEAEFALHPSLPFVGGSPDGLIGSDGMLEIKSPYSSVVHIKTIFAQAMPAEHVYQVQGNLWIAGRAWCDFVSFDPRFPEPHRCFIQRIHRDEAMIATIEKACIEFWAETQAMLKTLGGASSGDLAVSASAA